MHHTITLAAFDVFVDKLRRHDWDHAYSDDHNAYKRGEQQHTEILHMVSHTPACKAAYLVWTHYRNRPAGMDNEIAIAARDAGIQAIREQVAAQQEKAA